MCLCIVMILKVLIFFCLHFNLSFLQGNPELLSSWISFNTIGVFLNIFAIIGAVLSLNPIKLVTSSASCLVSLYAVMVVTSYK